MPFSSGTIFRAVSPSRSPWTDYSPRRRSLYDDAAAADLSGIEWFLDSRIGRVVRLNSRRLLREVPVYFGEPASEKPNSVEPMDRVMVRGRIDLLVPTGGGWLIVDYKTGGYAGRAETYEPQLALYQSAVRQILGEGAGETETALVFLSARRIVS